MVMMAFCGSRAGFMSKRVLIVDDERALADTLSQILTNTGYECNIAHDGLSALKLVDEFKPVLVISDVVMPGLNGVELAKRLRVDHPDCAVLLISGNAATQELLELSSGQGHQFQVLAKPVPPRELLTTIAEMSSGCAETHAAEHGVSSANACELPQWKDFREGLTENPGTIRPIIAGSWVRSREAGVDSQSPGTMLCRVASSELNQRIRNNRRLVDAALPLIHRFSETQNHLKHIVCVTDQDGIILHSTGNDDLMLAYGLGPGFDWSERSMGTNGMGTAIATDQPVAVIGPEHYQLSFHQVACLDCPIHNQVGKVIGTVNFSTALVDADPRQLRDIVALAQSLEEALAHDQSATDKAASVPEPAALK
jgi:CheY-like chemotaxis protein